MTMQENMISFSVLHGCGEFQWSAGLVVLFALSGHTTVFVDSKQIELSAAGIAVLNPFEPFQVDCSDEGKAVRMDIPREYLRLAVPEGQIPRILCHISDQTPGVSDEFDRLRTLYARIFHDFFQDDTHLRPRMTSNVLSLLTELLERFSAPDTLSRGEQHAAERLARLLTYVHEHWKEDISLSDLAAQEYLSANYLSRFFQKYVHATFTEYLTGVRLQYASRTLVQGQESVTRIAFECGFKNVNSFIDRFRDRYHETPGQYRRKALERSQMQLGGQTSDRAAEDMSVLLRYGSVEDMSSTTALPAHIETREISCDIRKPLRSLRGTWRRLLNIGYARDGLLAAVQDQLRRAQDEIGFEYLRFHGVFDEDMHVYREDEQGNPLFDFTYVDMLLDFILSVNLKPYIELSFMPELLSENKLCFFDRRSYISTFCDEAKWRLLVRQTLMHWIRRYGREAVCQWRFSTMAISIAMLGHMSYESYYQHYAITREALKSVDRGLLFGGPGGFASAIWDNACMERFLQYTQEHDCAPDFFTTQSYPHRSIEHDGEFMRFTVSQDSAPSVLSRDESFTATLLRDFKALLQRFGLSDREIWLEEWNSTLWQRDLSSDTCYKAAWLVKNVCDTFDDAEAFGYWLLTDFIEERAALGSVFHGGYGLFTYNGIPKAGWRAMLFLRQMGDALLYREPGCSVTKDKTGLQILLNHYCHYDNLYRYRYRVLTSPADAYSVFVKKDPLRFVIRIDGLEDGTYRVKRREITPSAGSAFDKWREMGEPAYLRAEEAEYLANVSRPTYFVNEQAVCGALQLEVTLPPHGVQLITLTRLGQSPTEP